MNYDENICKQLRKKIYLTAERGGMGHIASCYSCLEILYVLYKKGILNCSPENMYLRSRDRLILSKGHAGLALYWVMNEAGLLESKEIRTFLQPGSNIGGEPCMRDLSGIEATTGSLGHGLSMGVGIAMAQRMDDINAHTYVILGDGECEEGSIWEAAMSASAFALDNLTAIMDCNEIQKMTTVKKTIGLTNWQEKWNAFGWLVKEVDGHDLTALEEVFREKNATGKPLMLIAHTIKGKGVSIMENNPLWHFKLPNKKEKKTFAEELDIKEEELKNAASIFE